MLSNSLYCVMKPYERILLGAVLLTGLLEVSTSLKCANCFATKLCNEEKECSPGQVCYMTKYFRYLFEDYTYRAGCGLEQTHCLEQSPSGQMGRPEETKCCDTGDMCNAHFTFTLGSNLTSTSTTTTEPTTATPSFQLMKGIECHVCSGPACGVTEDETVMKCPDNFPNCMNIVLNDASGSKFVTKRCAKRSECQRKQDSACVNFDPSAIYPKSLECIYCCETNGCNKYIVPKADTLLLG